MNPTKYIWLDGKLVPWNEAKIHVLSHALHYGTAVFEGMRSYMTVREIPAIFRGKDHIDRLFNSAKIYRMEIPFTKEEILEACKLIIRKNELGDSYIRPIIFRGYKELGIDPSGNPIRVAIAAWEWGEYLGKGALEMGIRAKTSAWRRIPPQCLPLEAKASGNYINSVLAKLEAKEVGYQEAIMLDYRGMVSEGTGENIFIVIKGKIYTPPLYASILPGITRDTVMEIARDLGYEVYESELTLADIYTADEAFFTGTACEITPIVNVDGIMIGHGKPGPITRKIQKTYFDIVRGKLEKYNYWLDYIEVKKPSEIVT